MKKIICIVCALAMFLTCFSSCIKDDDNKDTPAAEFKPEKLYYYPDLYDLLVSEQEETDLGTFNVYEDFTNLYLYNQDDEPQYALHATGKCASYLDQSIALPFSIISSNLDSNPFSSFNLLIKEGWVKSIEAPETNPTGILFDFSQDIFSEIGYHIEYNSPKYSVNEKYAYSEQGCVDFLRTVRIMENMNWGSDGFVVSPYQRQDLHVEYSPEDDCYFSFIIKYNGSYSDITALYFRSSDGKYIDDVTVQVMCASYPTGDYTAGVSLSFASIALTKMFSKMSLFMALEQALTGNCIISDAFELSIDDHNQKFLIPYKYEGDNYKAEISEKFYETDAYYPDDSADPEYFKLYTYSVKLK